MDSQETLPSASLSILPRILTWLTVIGISLYISTGHSTDQSAPGYAISEVIN